MARLDRSLYRRPREAEDGRVGASVPTLAVSVLPLVVATATVAAPGGGRVGELSPAVEIERAVARVGPTVITATELVLETQLVLLRERGPGAAAAVDFGPDALQRAYASLETLNRSQIEPSPRPQVGDGDELSLAELLDAVLAHVVTRSLLLTEAQRLGFPRPSEARVDADFADLVAVAGGRGPLRRALERSGFRSAVDASGRTPPDLAEILRAEIWVVRLIDRGARQPLTEADIEACYGRLADALGRPGLRRVRDRLETAMRTARAMRSASELLDRIEARVEVRYAAPFRRRPRPDIELCPPPEVW